MLALLKGRPYAHEATIFGQAIHLLMDEGVGVDEVSAELERAGFAGAEIRPIPPSLEDVFVTLTNALKE